MPLVYAGQRITADLLSSNYVFSDINAVNVTAASLTDLTATFTVPAGDAVVGNIYEIEAWGNGTWGSTAQSLNFQVVFGGNVMTGFTYDSSYFPVNQIFRFRLIARVICLTIGSSGSFQSMLHGELSAFGNNLVITNSNAGTTGAAISCESVGSTTIDTTSAQGLKIQAAWNSTTGAPTITKRNAFQRKLGVG